MLTLPSVLLEAVGLGPGSVGSLVSLQLFHFDKNVAFGQNVRGGLRGLLPVWSRLAWQTLSSHTQ